MYLLEKTARRSISMMRSPKNTSNTQIQKYKNSSEFEDRKKRFSSDSGLIGNLANKKIVVPEACNMEKGNLYIKYILCALSLNNILFRM